MKNENGPVIGPVFDSARWRMSGQLVTLWEILIHVSRTRCCAMRMLSPTTSQLTIGRCSATADPEPVVVAGPVVHVSEIKATLTVNATPRIIPNNTRMVASQKFPTLSSRAENAPNRDWFRSGRIEIKEIAALPEVGNTVRELFD